MLISQAYAAAVETSDAALNLAAAPSPMEAFIYNMGLVVVLVALFYILLIMPQQRRFKEHSSMLSDLKKGDRIVTGGGLVGKIDTIIDDQEVLIDLGGGQKVTALRTMIQGKTELKPSANENKASKSTKDAKTSKSSKDSKASKAKK